MAAAGSALAARTLAAYLVPATTLLLRCAGIAVACAALLAALAAAAAADVAVLVVVATAPVAVAPSAVGAAVASAVDPSAADTIVGSDLRLRLEISRWVLQSLTALSRDFPDRLPLPLAPPLHYVLMVARSSSEIPTVFALLSGHLVRL